MEGEVLDDSVLRADFVESGAFNDSAASMGRLGTSLKWVQVFLPVAGPDR